MTFLSGILAKFDTVLILRDFNIHVCCHQKPLVKEFLNFIDSFNLIQSVKNLTHEHGHTLDLVLFCGLQLHDIQICKLNFSDHILVLFQISAPCSSVKPLLPVRQYRIVTPATMGHFSAAYQNSGPTFMDNCSLNQNVDYLPTMFNVTCTNNLDMVAPLKKTKN